MKKRILSFVLALAMCLGLLPVAALAAGDSYGPDDDGYGYTVSETSFDLGTIKHDGSGLKKSDAFSYTVTNTGEKPIKVNAGGFGRYETMFRDTGHTSWIPLEPGESVTLHYDMEVEAGAPTRTESGESWAQSYQYVELGDNHVDTSVIIWVDFKIVNTSETPEPTPTPAPTPTPTPTPSGSSSGSGSGSGYVDENGQYWGSDNMGNRYLGVQVGGNYGGNSFVSGGGNTVNLGEDLSIREGESYGFTVSPHHITFDPCFVDEEVEPQYVTLTNTNDTALDDIYSGFFVGGGYYSSPISMRIVEGKLNSDGALDPGKSVTYEVTLNPYKEGSGTVTYEGQFCLYSYTAVSIDSHGFGVGKGGHYGKIPGVLTVDYDVRPLSEVKGGDIDWDVGVKSIDFGVSDIFLYGYHKRQEKEFTVTNRGSYPFDLEVEVDASKCQRKDQPFGVWVYDNYDVKPGQSATVKVLVDSDQWDPGTVEGCVLKLNAYYPDTREKNSISATIPLSIKYLYDGGYVIANMSDNSYGTTKTSDGVDRGPYSGNSWFTAKEGGSVTFVMTPYDPTAYTVTDIKLGGKSVGTSGLVNNTYTISNIRDNYEFEAVFGPITDPALQQPVEQQPVEQPPVVGSAEPAAWAAGFVAQAIEEYILPDELQNAYDQPITRREFCALADRLYFRVNGNFPIVPAPPFTDCDDMHVLDMAAMGVVTGVGDGAFNPDGQLTREQAATVLARLANVLNRPLADSEPTFADNAEVAGWAWPFVGQMQQSGIMGGTGENRFSPQMSYTREQSVVTIMRMYELLK